MKCQCLLIDRSKTSLSLWYTFCYMFCSVSLTNVFFFSFNSYVSLRYIQLSLGDRVATSVGKAIYSFLWLFTCINLSFPLMLIT